MNKRLNNPMFLKGVTYYIIHLIFSFINDSITKFLIADISGWQIIFFRLFTGSVILSIIMLYKGRESFRTRRLKLHFARAVILFIAMLFWSLGLRTSVLTQATLVAFMTPIFVLILAPYFLKEKVSFDLYIATIVGFMGVLIAVKPSNQSFNIGSLYLIIATMLFAMLDILNKKYIVKESMTSMLFYSSLIASMCALVPASTNWVSLSFRDLLLLIGLGISGKLLLFFLLKSFSMVNASSLSPFRYIEIIISAVGGWLIFSDKINMSIIIGSCLIVPASYYIYRKKSSEKGPELQVSEA